MSTKRVKRAAIYCRISKDVEGKSLGLERQEHECRLLAERGDESPCSAYGSRRQPIDGTGSVRSHVDVGEDLQPLAHGADSLVQDCRRGVAEFGSRRVLEPPDSARRSAPLPCEGPDHENRPPNAAHGEAFGRLFHSRCEDGQVISAQTSSMMLPMCPLTVPSGWNVTSIGPALTEICGTPSVAA